MERQRLSVLVELGGHRVQRAKVLAVEHPPALVHEIEAAIAPDPVPLYDHLREGHDAKALDRRGGARVDEGALLVDLGGRGDELALRVHLSVRARRARCSMTAL